MSPFFVASTCTPFQRIELRPKCTASKVPGPEWGKKMAAPPPLPVADTPPLVDDEPDQGHDLLLLFGQTRKK